jgi:hypothetical protein
MGTASFPGPLKMIEARMRGGQNGDFSGSELNVLITPVSFGQVLGYLAA